MDAQLKRGFLEACVLAALARQDSYGYQIIKDIPPQLGLTESTLYPILKRLEQADCLVVYAVEHSGRLRKYYRITGVGIQRINEFIAEWEDIVAFNDYIRGGINS
ncbi:MAG: PadR family transcriptional regulator [Eggerthellaceae bacterium]|nr:PadR family transcriptional regulator [Eggerthellaceae bacterium]